MSNSPLVSYTKISPNRTSPRNHKIDTITIHCYVGQVSVESMGGWLCNPSAEASANYGIGVDGRIGMFVEEKDRSWCSSSASNDNRAITIECASDKTNPYAINDKVYNSLIKLCADICKRNGIKELKWKADKSLIGQVDKQNMTVHRWFKNKACVPTYSEVLTRSGWVPLYDIEVGDEIACADLDNLNITFEEVYDMVPLKEQDTYTNCGLTATKDHRMVYSYQQSKELYKINDFKHLLKDGTQVYIPLAGYSNFEGFPISDDMLRFLIAVQADGHYMYDVRKTDRSTHHYGVEFHLKKPRKIEAIKEILESIGFEYKLTNQSNGSVKIRIYNQAGTNIADDVCEKYLKNKCFTWKWLNLSSDQAKIFLDEILYWDGCVEAKLYSSKDIINLDVVNAIAAINGVGSRVFACNVQFRNSPYMTLGSNTKRHNKQHNTRYTKVSCVSVKTGIFLMRQDGKTFVVGNCPGEYIYSRLGQIASEVNAILGVSGGSSKPQNGLQATSLKSLSEAEVVAKVGPLFTEDQKNSGILASISLAQFILESGYGKTDLAQEANNCFGMKTKLSGNTWSGSTWDGKSKYTKITKECYDGKNFVDVKADFRKYPNIEKSIGDHSAYLLGAKNGSAYRYVGLKDCKDHKKAIQIIKNGGYATDPKYVDKILNIIDRWDLKKYDCEESNKPSKPSKPSGSNTTFPKVPFEVRVIIDDLNYRPEPSMNCNPLGHTGKGVFTITKVTNGWGKLKSGVGWIYLENKSYCTILDTVDNSFSVKVNIDYLRIRKGPGTDYDWTGKFTGKGVFTIIEEHDGWGRLKSGAGWISLDYAKRI